MSYYKSMFLKRFRSFTTILCDDPFEDDFFEDVLCCVTIPI